MTTLGRPSAFGPGHAGEALSALLDGELNETEAVAVGRHLADCLECRLEMGRLSEARRQLRALAAVPAPPELAQRTRARIGWQRKAVTLAAVLASVTSALVLWAARPEAEVTALPAAAYGLVQFYPAAGASAVSSAGGAAFAPAAASASGVGDTTVARTTAATVSVSLSAPASAQPMALSSLPAGFLAPSVVDGMALAGVWGRGGILVAVYGQGASRLSLLEQAGRLVASVGQRWTVLGTRRGQTGRWGADTTFASQMGPDLVVTAIGSGQDVAEVANSMDRTKVNPPWIYRARTLARRLVVELTGS